MAYEQQDYIPHRSGGWTPRMREPADSASGKRPVLTDGWWSSPHALTWRRAGALWGLLQGHYASPEGFALVTHLLAKLPAPTPLPWALGAQHTRSKGTQMLSPQQGCCGWSADSRWCPKGTGRLADSPTGISQALHLCQEPSSAAEQANSALRGHRGRWWGVGTCGQ